MNNPAFEKDGNGDYVPNAFDAPATDFSSHTLAPVERTYSEWFYSQYNLPSGVYAPQFGGNKDYVATCQDCHMRDVTGQGCNMSPPVREDLPLHDMTGGSTWFPGLLSTLFPGKVNDAALQDGILRARSMLQNAAEMSLEQQGRDLLVTLVNKCGHKLPTGYPEGRRMWINVKFYDEGMSLIDESGEYDSATGELSHEEGDKIYEIKPGLDEVTAPLVGVDPGASFHFVLNNAVFKDNRIPPQGFANADYAAFGGPPVAHTYADGQYWDVTTYTIPDDASSVGVTLYYQSTSKEFIEFLRDENADSNGIGQELYDLWANNDKCPPEMMVQTQLALAPPIAGDYDGDGQVSLADYAEFPACMTGPGGRHAGGCEPFDFNGDSDIDLDDFAGFQVAQDSYDIAPPAVPTGLSATGDDMFISLDWDDNADADLAGYNVLRSTNSGGPYLKINAAALGASDFTDTGLSNGVTYYYVVTAADTSGNVSGSSSEAGATPQPAGGTTMHVESIVPTVDDQGGGNKYGVATVTVLDDLGLPVESADVTGTFSGEFTGTLTDTTDANGVAVLIIGPKNGSTDYTFCVDDVVHATLVYDSNTNVETCDSYP